ncbi:MAG: hypothetical protein IKQ27_00550 [Lachnospiraceae bacterium]|nr:hypothetical protein [Lachnospiraceae bacterium]
MIRTDTVSLTVIPAVAFRQKLKQGGSGIVILRPEARQPGIASISRTSGDPIINQQTDQKLFPEEAFKEAMRLTLGLPYRKTTPVKVTEDMIVKEIKEEEPEPEIKLNEEAYQAIVARYTDKSGHLSYDLINKEMIRFAKSSSIVRGMIQEGKKASVIRNYIVSNKFRNIADNDDLTNADIKLIVEMLDEVSPKGVFKELDAEIRKMLGAQKKAV